MVAIIRETAHARAIFDRFIKKHECYGGQICIATPTFRRELMIPILKKMKDLEEKADEQK